MLATAPSTTPSLPPLRALGRQIIASIVLTPTRRGSIIMPYERNTQEAIVVSPGERTDLAPGDRIIWRPYNVRGFDYEGEHYVLLTDAEVEGKVEA
jgi:co-chaperonin GroES (HSP10)